MPETSQPDITLTRMRPSAFLQRYADATDGYIYFTPHTLNTERFYHHYIVATDGHSLAGYASCREMTTPEIYIGAVEVHPDFRGERLSGRLLTGVFEIAAELKRGVIVSHYSEMGKAHLHHQIERLQKNFPGINVCYEFTC